MARTTINLSTANTFDIDLSDLDEDDFDWKNDDWDDLPEATTGFVPRRTEITVATTSKRNRRNGRRPQAQKPRKHARTDAQRRRDGNVKFRGGDLDDYEQEFLGREDRANLMVTVGVYEQELEDMKLGQHRPWAWKPARGLKGRPYSTESVLFRVITTFPDGCTDYCRHASIYRRNAA